MGQSDGAMPDIEKKEERSGRQRRYRLRVSAIGILVSGIGQELLLPFDVAPETGYLMLVHRAAREKRIDGGAEIFASDGNIVARTAAVQLTSIG